MNILCTFQIFICGYVTYRYLVPEAKTYRLWYDYELGPQDQGNGKEQLGIYFERLVQAMEGERENTRPPERRDI